MKEKQRADAYKMYVTDSLFFLQHLVAQNENDDDRQMFSSKYRDIMENYENPKDEEDAEEIRNRIIEKVNKLAGEKI